MNKLEKDLEAKLVKGIKAAGGLCLKWVCPGWAGVPDRIVILHRRIFFVEMKRPKGSVVAERQKWWAEKLREYGFEVFTAFTDFQVDDIVEEAEDWELAAKRVRGEFY